jgi:ribosomal 30S subunit maturation factor RimM
MGLKGEAILEVLTDFPERFQAGVLLYAGESLTCHCTFRSVRPHDKVLLVAFEGLDTPETVGEHCAIRLCMSLLRTARPYQRGSTTITS